MLLPWSDNTCQRQMQQPTAVRTLWLRLWRLKLLSLPPLTETLQVRCKMSRSVGTIASNVQTVPSCLTHTFTRQNSCLIQLAPSSTARYSAQYSCHIPVLKCRLNEVGECFHTLYFVCCIYVVYYAQSTVILLTNLQQGMHACIPLWHAAIVKSSVAAMLAMQAKLVSRVSDMLSAFAQQKVQEVSRTVASLQSQLATGKLAIGGSFSELHTLSAATAGHTQVCIVPVHCYRCIDHQALTALGLNSVYCASVAQYIVLVKSFLCLSATRAWV